MDGLVIWQRIEAALVMLAGIALFWQIDSGLVWWAALLAFFAPDLSFLAYGFGPRVGARLYNTVHIYGFGGGLLALGLLIAQPMLAGLGALWLAHSGFDRMLGYGLKSEQGFAFTHLGHIGKARSTPES